MFLKPLHKGITQCNVFWVFLIKILGKSRNGAFPFLLQFHAARNDFHFFLPYFGKSELDIHHCLINEHFCLITYAECLFLVDDTNTTLHFRD